MIKLADSFLWNIGTIMNFLFSKRYMKKDDSIVYAAVQLCDSYMCHSTL